MAEEKYQYDENGFREDLKNDSDVLHQPDADRSAWQLETLDYGQTIAVLNGDTPVKPVFDFDEEVLKKIRQDKPDLKSDEDVDSVIEDKYQQILLARYNESQAKNITISENSED